MNAEVIFIKFEKHTRAWIAAMDAYDEANFKMKPSAGEWSIAEVIDHLESVTEKCLANAMLCVNQKGERGHRAIGPAIFSLMGSFPPVKLKIKKIPAGMEKIYFPKQITKAEASEKLTGALEKMKEAIPAIKTMEKDQRVEHWAGGWFNALQWYHSAEMHLKHHFRQKKRIDAYLEKVNPGRLKRTFA